MRETADFTFNVSVSPSAAGPLATIHATMRTVEDVELAVEILDRVKVFLRAVQPPAPARVEDAPESDRG